MTWAEALQYAQTAKGIAFIVGILLFALSEYIPGFVEQIQDRKKKRLAVLALSMVIPVGALSLEIFTVSYATVTFDMVWNSIFTGLVTFGTSTLVQTSVMKKST